jgi:putative ABC transport system permease protein
MLRHNLLLFFRNFKRNKNSFIINLLGLSTGLACAILIYLWVNDELGVDKFHENESRLYLAMKNEKQPNGIETGEYTTGGLAAALAKEIPEVENASAVIPYWFENKGIATVGGTRIKASETYVDQQFFNIFSYPFVDGEKQKQLLAKNQVAISDELAKKLFGTTSHCVGKVINWEQGDFGGPYIVSGVFKKLPANSTVQFDLAFSYDMFMEKKPEWMKWGNSSSKTYLLLKKGTDVAQFNKKIAGYLQKKEKGMESYTLFIKKYSDQYLYGRYENGVEAGGRISYVRLFSIIAIFILVIACINFMNLSTARATGRLKEVGIKKVVGASRRMLVFQYLGESLLMTIISLALAIVLVAALLPQFNIVTGKQMTLQPDNNMLLAAAIITVVTGLVAGSYPALYLSGFKPVAILKGKLKLSFGETLARKGLVVFQFAVSVILIVAVMVVYKQMEFIQTKNLGYSRDNIVYFDVEEKSETFMNEIKRLPGVVHAARTYHNLTGNHGTAWGFNWQDQLPGGGDIKFTNLEVGHGFVETFNMQMIAGKAFNKDLQPNEQLILNEAAVQAMGLKDPVGKWFDLWGRKRIVIGVVKNFHYASLYSAIGPGFLNLVPFHAGANKIMVKLKPGTEKNTIAQLQKAYQQYNPGLSFDYKFVDEDYQALYSSEKRVSVLSKYFAGLAIVISCLGLFGLAAFTAEKRRKEIGIRKVLGATIQHISLLLTRQFVWLVLISNLVAWPVAWYLMNNWLRDFAYKIDIGWWMFALATSAALVITLITVSFHAVKAAVVNPVKSLRTE